MKNTLLPSVVNEEMNTIELEIKSCLDKDELIDPKKLKRLCELRNQRIDELVSTHDQRLEIMKTKTRELTEKLCGLSLDGKPDIKEQLLAGQDQYDIAAIHWVNYENSQWGESGAPAIAASLLMLVQ